MDQNPPKTKWWHSTNLLKLILSYPMIFLQLVFLTYLFLTPLYYLSQTHSLLAFLLNSLILLSTYTLTVASLLQTFRSDPGYLSMHHIE